MDSKFAYPSSNRAMVTKIALLDTLNTDQDHCFGPLVTELSEPFLEVSGINDFYAGIVSYKRQAIKLGIE